MSYGPEDMEELSENTKNWLKELGDFSITKRGDSFKGYMWFREECGTCKTYLEEHDLRRLAEAADLLSVIADTERNTL